MTAHHAPRARPHVTSRDALLDALALVAGAILGWSLGGLEAIR